MAGAETVGPMTARERSRRKIVLLIFVVYGLLILEGVLRKWVFPSASQALFFVRDPFVLVIYVLALLHGWWPKQNAVLLAAYVLAALGLLLVLMQAVGGGAAPERQLLLAAYGWRNYFFNIPLAFVIAAVFERDDMRRLVRATLWMAVPSAVLVFLQFYSSPDAAINVGVATDAALQFHGLGLDEDHTRPMGTFTSDLGQKEFVVSCVAMLFAGWLVPARRRLAGLWTLGAGTVAAGVCLALSGSRGAMVASALVMLAAIAAGLVSGSKALARRAILWPTAIGVAAVVLYPLVFRTGYAAFMRRWTTAAMEEHDAVGSLGIVGRALYGFIDFFRLVGETPLLGYGLGMAGNASSQLNATVRGVVPIGLAETDFARHMVDLGPVLGVAFILLRLVIAGLLLERAVTAARRYSEPLPLLLFGFAGIDMLLGTVSGHGTVNGYCWIFTGLCLAAARLAQPSAVGTGAATPSAFVPRFSNLLR